MIKMQGADTGAAKVTIERWKDGEFVNASDVPTGKMTLKPDAQYNFKITDEGARISVLVTDPASTDNRVEIHLDDSVNAETNRKVAVYNREAAGGIPQESEIADFKIEGEKR